jgi:hypothetical protein
MEWRAKPPQRQLAAARVANMPAHKFILGQKVAFQAEFGQVANRGEVFTVIRQLPETNGVLQYQIKSEIDGHVRVVPERQIADL